MSVLPATHNFTFLQNATWEFYSRFCVGALATEYQIGAGLFQTQEPHNRIAGTPVVLVRAEQSALTTLPFGFSENRTYYVAAAGLTDTEFALAESIGGTAIVSMQGQGSLYSAVPIDLTGVTVDCDIVGNLDSTFLRTFQVTLLPEEPGVAHFRIEAEDTADAEPGVFRYDVSLTMPDGTRFYPQAGVINVVPTASREP